MGEVVVGGQRPCSYQVWNLWCLACTQLALKMDQAQMSTVGKSGAFVNVCMMKPS